MGKRIDKKVFGALEKKFHELTKITIYKKIEKLKSDRGHDIELSDAALLLASLNKIDISKFTNSEKLKEIRALKEDKYIINTQKDKTIEKDRILNLKDLKISSKEPYITKQIILNSQKMNEYYIMLFILENSLRNLIRGVFHNEINWWNKKVPKGIRDSVNLTKSKEKYFQEERDDDLEYTHLGNLKEIIVYNWKDFSKILKERDKSRFIFKMDEIIPSRHGIGHCVILKGGDAKRFVHRIEEIFRML